MRALIFGLVLAALPAPAVAQEAGKTSIPDLANQICDAFGMYSMTELGPLHEAFELVIYDHLGITADTPDHRSKLRDFWNKHHQQMICTEKLPALQSPQHILKRVIDMQNTSTFFFDYFLIDRGLNINAVEQTADGPETLLDYLDKILASPGTRHLYYLEEIKTLRSFLVEHMNGKRGAELMAEKDRTED